jgi:fatty acid desaturase
MTKSEKNRLLLWNSIIWIAAMVLPFVLNLTLGATKFPWPMFLLYSNNVLSKVIGEPTDGAATETTAKV